MHDLHDYEIYLVHEKELERRYAANKNTVAARIQELLPDIGGLHGQWSIDVMQNGDDFWIIDMALAENSAFYDKVPERLRRPSKENWLPDLSQKETE